MPDNKVSDSIISEVKNFRTIKKGRPLPPFSLNLTKPKLMKYEKKLFCFLFLLLIQRNGKLVLTENGINE
jgi:hypothetical protein